MHHWITLTSVEVTFQKNGIQFHLNSYEKFLYASFFSISVTVLGILLLSIIPKYYCDDDTDELREALIKTKDN